MKKHLLIFIAILSFKVHAQTLTQVAYEPKTGDVQLSLPLDTSMFSSGLPLSQTGTNVSWNFSNLKAVSMTFTTNFDAPSTSSHSVDFPTSTVVQKDGPNFQVFIRSASSPTTQTEVLGIRTPSLSTTFTDVAIAAIYPISLGSTHTDNIAGTFTMSGFSGNCSGKVSVTADASGSLTLPDGFVYNQVLRVKSTQTLTASAGLISGSLRQTTYDFYDMTEKFPVLSVTYSRISFGIGSPTVTAGVSGNARSFLASINERGLDRAFSVYPSPTTDQLTVTCDICGEKTGSSEIIDAMGRIVQNQPINGQINRIDVSGLETGMYTIILKHEGKQALRKIVIE